MRGAERRRGLFIEEVGISCEGSCLPIIFILRETLEKFFTDFTQAICLALQQLLLLNWLHAELYLQDGVDNFSQQLLRKDASQPDHQDLIQQDVACVMPAVPSWWISKCWRR